MSSHHKIHLHRGLHVIAYGATLDVSRELAEYLSHRLRAERRRRGTRTGARALTCFRQAVLGLRWFRQNAEVTALARDAGISRATGYRYLDAARARLAKATAELRRFQAAIAAGIDPSAVVDVVNDAQAQRVAAQAELDGLPAATRVTRAELYAKLDMLGDVGAVLRKGSPEKLSALYCDLGVELRFHPGERAVDVTACPRVVSECVRGGT